MTAAFTAGFEAGKNEGYEKGYSAGWEAGREAAAELIVKEIGGKHALSPFIEARAAAIRKLKKP